MFGNKSHAELGIGSHCRLKISSNKIPYIKVYFHSHKLRWNDGNVTQKSEVALQQQMIPSRNKSKY